MSDVKTKTALAVAFSIAAAPAAHAISVKPSGPAAEPVTWDTVTAAAQEQAKAFMDNARAATAALQAKLSPQSPPPVVKVRVPIAKHPAATPAPKPQIAAPVTNVPAIANVTDIHTVAPQTKPQIIAAAKKEVATPMPSAPVPYQNLASAEAKKPVPVKVTLVEPTVVSAAPVLALPSRVLLPTLTLKDLPQLDFDQPPPEAAFSVVPYCAETAMANTLSMLLRRRMTLQDTRPYEDDKGYHVLGHAFADDHKTIMLISVNIQPDNITTFIAQPERGEKNDFGIALWVIFPGGSEQFTPTKPTANGIAKQAADKLKEDFKGCLVDNAPGIMLLAPGVTLPKYTPH